MLLLSLLLLSLLLSLWWYIGEQGKNSAIATVPKKLEILLLSDTVGIPFCPGSSVLLLTAEILHQLMDSLSHYLQGFIHPRWCRISAINSKSQVISRVVSFPHESFSATQGLNHNTKIFFVSAHSSRAFAHFFLGRTWSRVLLKATGQLGLVFRHYLPILSQHGHIPHHIPSPPQKMFTSLQTWKKSLHHVHHSSKISLEFVSIQASFFLPSDIFPALLAFSDAPHPGFLVLPTQPRRPAGAMQRGRAPQRPAPKIEAPAPWRWGR